MTDETVQKTLLALNQEAMRIKGGGREERGENHPQELTRSWFLDLEEGFLFLEESGVEVPKRRIVQKFLTGT